MQTMVIKKEIPVSRAERIRGIPLGGDSCIQEPYSERFSVYATVGRLTGLGMKFKTHVDTNDKGEKVVNVWRLK